MKRVKLLPSICQGRTKHITWTKRAISITSGGVETRLPRGGPTTTDYLSRNRSFPRSPRCILMSREQRRSASGVAASLQKTGLYDTHVSHGAKMVPFAGYLMPVQYSDQAVSESHRWTREKSSIFDVSHMYVSSQSGHMLRI